MTHPTAHDFREMGADPEAVARALRERVAQAIWMADGATTLWPWEAPDDLWPQDQRHARALYERRADAAIRAMEGQG